MLSGLKAYKTEKGEYVYQSYDKTEHEHFVSKL